MKKENLLLAESHAKKIAEQIFYPHKNTTTKFCCGLIKDAFLSGISYGSRWISILQELPKIDEKTGRSETIIFYTPDDSDSESKQHIGFYRCGAFVFDSGDVCWLKVTHFKYSYKPK